MKVLGLKSVIGLGSVKYKVTKIARNGVTLTDFNNSSTIFQFKDLEDNLKSGVMKVCSS